MKNKIQIFSLFIAFTAGLGAMAEDHLSDGIQQRLDGELLKELDAREQKTAFWQMCEKAPVNQWDSAAKYLLNKLNDTGLSNPFKESEFKKQIINALSHTLNVAKGQKPISDPEVLERLDSSVKAIQNSKDPDVIRSAYNELGKIRKTWNQIEEGAKSGQDLDNKKKVTRAQAQEFIREMKRIQALQRKGFAIALNKEAFEKMAPYIQKHFPEDYRELIAPKSAD